MREVACDLCGSGDHRFLFRSGLFCLVRCSQCGLIFVNPQPDRQELAPYYDDHYCAFHRVQETGLGSRLKAVLLAPAEHPPLWIRLMAGLYRHHARTYPLDLPPGRILDVGCGAGDFLARMRQWGWDVVGLEPSAIAGEAARAHGLEVLQNTLEEASLPEESFDVIRLNHVLEHLHRPLESLVRLRRALKPGGRVLIAVPNFGSPLARLCKGRWFHCDIPRHLYHFTEATLRAALERAGFRSVIIDLFCSFSINLISLLGWWGLPIPVPIGLPLVRCRRAREGSLADELVACAQP